MSAVELFCGYGGSSEGIVRAGLEYEVGYDIWPTAVAAHRAWHSNLRVEVRDVRDIRPEELEDRFVWASPPCQPWSLANQRRRGKDHPFYYPLEHLAWQFSRVRLAIMEQVPGLLFDSEGREELARMESRLRQYGLQMSVNLIPSYVYGVPQERRRLVVVIGKNLPMMLVPQRAGRGLSGVTTRRKSWDGKALEPEEIAALQEVPYEPLRGFSRKDQYTLLGNCVPPSFAEGVIKGLFRVG